MVTGMVWLFMGSMVVVMVMLMAVVTVEVFIWSGNGNSNDFRKGTGTITNHRNCYIEGGFK